MTIYNATPAITSDNHSPLQSNFNIVTKSINHSIVITRPTPATGGTLFGFGTWHNSRKMFFSVYCDLWIKYFSFSPDATHSDNKILKLKQKCRISSIIYNFYVSSSTQKHHYTFRWWYCYFFPNLRYFRNTIQSARASGTIVETCTEQSSVKTQSNPLFTKLNGK